MFSVAIATVLFPALSRLVARNDMPGLRLTQGNGMRQIALLLIPSAAATIALAEPITRLVYQRGEFDAESTRQVSEALFWFSFSLPFSGFNLLLTRTFFSLQSPWTPTALAGVTLAINAIVSGLLYEPLGIGGVVLGTVASTAAMTAGQAYYLRQPDRRPAADRHRPRDRQDARGRGGLRRDRVRRMVGTRRRARALARRAARLGGHQRSPWRAWRTARSCSRCASRRRGRSSISSPAGSGAGPPNLQRPQWPIRRTSATSRSSPTSTMASRRWRTGSSS